MGWTWCYGQYCCMFSFWSKIFCLPSKNLNETYFILRATGLSCPLWYCHTRRVRYEVIILTFITNACIDFYFLGWKRCTINGLYMLVAVFRLTSLTFLTFLTFHSKVTLILIFHQILNCSTLVDKQTPKQWNYRCLE